MQLCGVTFFSLRREPRELMPGREKTAERIQVQAIQGAIARQAAFACEFHAPSHKVNLGCRVRVRVDAKHAAEFKPALVPAPVEIEPPRVRIDLDGNAVPRAGRE